MEFLGPQTLGSCSLDLLMLSFHCRFVSLSVEDLQGVTGKNAPQEHRLFIFLPIVFENGIKYSKGNNIYQVATIKFSLWHRSVLVLIHNQIVSKSEKQSALKAGNSIPIHQGDLLKPKKSQISWLQNSQCAFGIRNLMFFLHYIKPKLFDHQFYRQCFTAPKIRQTITDY